MKLKTKVIFIKAVSLIFLFLFCFFVVFAILVKFYEGGMIKAGALLAGATLLSFLIAVGIYVYSDKQDKKISKSKFDIWIHNNKSSLLLYTFFLGICVLATRTEISWTYEKAKEALSIEWTILGLAIALFVVWNTIIPKFLENKKPDRKMVSSIDKAILIEQKYDFYQMVSSSFGSVSLLSLNIFFLLFTTYYIYIFFYNITLWGQNITIISFFLCTNSFVDMFLGIFPPLMQSKKELLQYANVTQEDLKFVETVAQQLEETSAFFATIDSLESIGEAEKEKIKLEAAKKFSLTKGVNNDQL